jgi:type IV pilus assembly protein PilZ
VRGDSDGQEEASDRRHEDRKPIELKVEYQRLNAFFADYTKNISKGGTFIATESPLPVNTEFVFLLYVPVLTEPLRIRGRVKWVQTAEDIVGRRGESPGMGIRFVYADASEEAAVAAAVEQLMTDSLGPRISEKLMQSARKKEPVKDGKG